jgi:hypothetical protein
MNLNLSDSIIKSDKSEYIIDAYDRVVKKKSKSLDEWHVFEC